MLSTFDDLHDLMQEVLILNKKLFSCVAVDDAAHEKVSGTGNDPMKHFQPLST